MANMGISSKNSLDKAYIFGNRENNSAAKNPALLSLNNSDVYRYKNIMLRIKKLVTTIGPIRIFFPKMSIRNETKRCIKGG
jgi:hypothetical protein